MKSEKEWVIEAFLPRAGYSDLEGWYSLRGGYALFFDDALRVITTEQITDRSRGYSIPYRIRNSKTGVMVHL